MNSIKQWAVVVTIFLILDVLAVWIPSATDAFPGKSVPLPVSEVFDKVLLGEDVLVKGRVTKVLEDYVSKKGFVYQQFMISDGEEEIRIFCSTKYGKTKVTKGEEIAFEGEFKKYHGTYEIYGFCSEIRKTS